MNWHNPEAFFLFIPLFCVFIYFFFFSKNINGTFFYSGLKLFSKQNISIRAQLSFLPKFLTLISLVLIIFALARPQTTEYITNQNQKGIDIMIVMDISLSMLIEDMGGNTRLESSKQVVSDFIEARPNDRIGLIVFSGESFTKVPLTFDHKLLKKELAQVQSLQELKDGTAIGVALANATARLKNSPPDSRTVIFLTDGENNTGFIDPETALQIVRQNKIKVYTIGLGGRSGMFPIKQKIHNSKGQYAYRRVYVTSHINKKLMKKISSQTGGEFFMAKNLTSLKTVFQEIDELETYEIQINKWTKHKEHFENFLLYGLVLYFLSVVFSITIFFRGI